MIRDPQALGAPKRESEKSQNVMGTLARALKELVIQSLLKTSYATGRGANLMLKIKNLLVSGRGLNNGVTKNIRATLKSQILGPKQDLSKCTYLAELEVDGCPKGTLLCYLPPFDGHYPPLPGAQDWNSADAMVAMEEEVEKWYT
ncbi:uncharacterized protein TNCV_801691 [Trichonephila clavipes]|nr:uncharacterized protein TNCV_801691 [Trichonephila clavipes]